MIDSHKAYEAMRAELGMMRADLKRLEALNIPVVMRYTAAIRVTMMSLATRLTELEANEAARRMCGEVGPLVSQAQVDELPIFTQAARVSGGGAPTVEELEAMERTLRRVGDDTELRDEGGVL